MYRIGSRPPVSFVDVVAIPARQETGPPGGGNPSEVVIAVENSVDERLYAHGVHPVSAPKFRGAPLFDACYVVF